MVLVIFLNRENELLSVMQDVPFALRWNDKKVTIV